MARSIQPLDSDLGFLVEVDNDGNLRYNHNMIQATIFSRNAGDYPISTFGIVDDVHPLESGYYCADVAENLLRKHVQSGTSNHMSLLLSLMPIAASINPGVDKQSRNGVLIRKVPHFSQTSGDKQMVFVLYVWMGMGDTDSCQNRDTIYTKLVDFVYCISSVVFVAYTAEGILENRFTWEKSILSTPLSCKFGNFPAMVLLVRCPDSWLQTVEYDLLRMKNGRRFSVGSSAWESVISSLQIISEPLSKAAASFSTLVAFVTKCSAQNGSNISDNFQLPKFERVCGPSSKHPVQARTFEQLVVRIVDEYNTAMATVAKAATSSPQILKPSADLPSQFVLFYTNSLALQAKPRNGQHQFKTLSVCHLEAVQYARAEVQKTSNASEPDYETLLHPEIVRLEKEVLQLEEKLHETFQYLETKFAMNLLKDPQNTTAKSSETLIAVESAPLIEVIHKAASHLQYVAATFYAGQKTSSLRRLAAAFERYVSSMTKLLTARVFLSEDELFGHHLSLQESSLNDPFCNYCPLAKSLVESAMFGWYQRCSLENVHQRKMAETMLTTASTLMFQAYKTTMTEALDRAVFTPEQLSSTHELASTSAMRSFNDLRTDQTSYVWESYAQKAKALLETELSLFEEMNAVNAIEVQQRGEDLVQDSLKAYDQKLGGSHQVEVHRGAKQKTLADFDNAVANDSRRGAVQMWRQKLVAGINAHFATVQDRLAAERLPNNFLKLKSSDNDKPPTPPKPTASSSGSRRRDLDTAIKRVAAKLSTTEASTAVVIQVRKVVQAATEVLNRREASDSEIDVSVRKLELWEKSVDKFKSTTQT